MPSERVQRQIDRLLDETEAALASRDWERVRALAGDVLRLDPENEDARSFLEASQRDGGAESSERTATTDDRPLDTLHAPSRPPSEPADQARTGPCGQVRPCGRHA